MKSSEKPFVKFIWSIFIGLLLVLVAIVSCGYFFLKITSIEVIGTAEKSYFGTFIGQNLFLLDTNQTETLIVKNIPTIQSVTIVKQFPNKLQITVKTAIPVAQIDNGDEYISVDKTSKIISIEQKKDSNLPQIKYFQHLRTFESKPGSVFEQLEIRAAISLVNQQNDLPFPLLSVAIPQQERLTINFSKSPLVVQLNAKKDIAKNIFILHNIMKGLNQKGIEPRVINLEFEKPIVTV